MRTRSAADEKSASGSVGVLAVLVLLWMLTTRLTDGVSQCPAVSPELATLRVDPNSASRDELLLLPGVGPTIAERILRVRERAGAGPAFATADDLERVRGIGPVKIDGLRAYLNFSANARASFGDPAE